MIFMSSALRRALRREISSSICSTKVSWSAKGVQTRVGGQISGVELGDASCNRSRVDGVVFGTAQVQPSSPILKFLCTGMDGGGAAAETSDGSENVVGSLGPTERLGLGIAGVDGGRDRRLQFLGGAMDPTPDLLLGE